MADFNPNPPRLVWSNLLVACSGAALLLSLLFSKKLSTLGDAILLSFMLLQFYRTVLLLFTVGAKATWQGMRKWKVKHWTAAPEGAQHAKRVDANS